MPELVNGLEAASMPEALLDEHMTTWRSIGRGSLGNAKITDSPSQSNNNNRSKRNSRQPLNFPAGEEDNTRPLISHPLVYQINREAGSNLERENWLEHEVQPTDSEIESIYKDRSSCLNEDLISTPILNVSRNTSIVSECETMEDEQCKEHKNGGMTSMPRSLARSVINLSEPMSKEELLRTMETLRDIYQKKFGGWPENSKQNGMDPASTSATRQTVERMDKDIDDLRSRVIKLSVEQHKLKEMLGIAYSPSTVQQSPVATNEYKTSQSQQSGGVYQSTSTASSELRTPSPRDAAMFIPMDEDNDDLEDKLKQRDKLILRQLQRRENLLQRRIQRATEKRYLEEERRLQEQWMEKAKADHDMRRNLILQSHQLEKQEERNYGTLPRSGKKTPSQLQSFLNGHEPVGDLDEYMFSRRANNASSSLGMPGVLAAKSSLDMQSNRFMAPTAASQRRMNRAASLMSGLNNPDLIVSPINNLSANSGSLHDLRVANGATTPRVGYGNNSHNNKLNDSHFGLNSIASNGSRMNGSTLSLSSNGGRHSRNVGRTSTKTNRNFMINAITHVSLAGQANKKQRDAVLQEIEASPARHFMILFRDHRLLYRALYTYSTDALSVEKIHGIGPMSVDESMIEKFFKYNSGNRSFVFIPAKRFSIQCDAFIIHDEYWHKRNRR